jgi:uncharacterized OB-fold protein
VTSSRRLLVSSCTSCHGRFLARDGPCPRCGSSAILPLELPALGVIVAAVELVAPAAPWPSPHRIALIELEDSVRVLALCPGPLPAIGERVEVVRDRDRYSYVPVGA